MHSMKKKIFISITVLLLLAVFLGGCATGMTPSSWYGMTADSEQAYVAGGANVYAIDLNTQAEVWRFPIKLTVFAAPVLTTDGQLLVGGYDHVLYSLDPADASENWQFTGARDRWIGSPLVANDTIYAPNADYNLYALNLDGELLWSFKADQSLWGTPVTDGELIYFGSLGGRVYALDAATGELVWKVENEGAILGSLVLADGRLFTSLFSGSLVAFDTRDGDMLWQETLDSGAWSGPLLEADTLYVGDRDGSLYAFSLSGKKLWQKSLDGAIVSSPILMDGELAVGTDAGKVYFISLDGNDSRNISVEGKVYSPLLTAGTYLLITPTAGDSTVIALEEGAESWSFTPEK
jgi:outer membrane protein assembly factor BamB